MPRRIRAERRRVEPVRARVVRRGEPAGQPQEVGPPGEPGPGGVQQALGVGDELAEGLAGGRAELLRAGRAVRVVPVGQLLPVRAGPSPCPLHGRAVRQGEPGQPGQRLQQRIDQLQDQADPVRDRGGVPVDVGGDQVDVDQQQLLEVRVLLAAEVVAAEDAGQVGVEIPDAVGEQALVAEDRRDLAGQAVGVDLVAFQHGQDAVEGLHDLAEQFPRHLARPVAGVQDGDRLPVQAAPELGHLVAGARPDVLGDRAYFRVAKGRHEVAPGDQLAAASLSDVVGDRQAPLGQLGGHLGGGQVGEQGRREQVHDRQVVGGLIHGQVTEQGMAGAIHRRWRDWLRRLHSGKARGARRHFSACSPDRYQSRCAAQHPSRLHCAARRCQTGTAGR